MHKSDSFWALETCSVQSGEQMEMTSAAEAHSSRLWTSTESPKPAQPVIEPAQLERVELGSQKTQREEWSPRSRCDRHHRPNSPELVDDVRMSPRTRDPVHKTTPPTEVKRAWHPESTSRTSHLEQGVNEAIGQVAQGAPLVHDFYEVVYEMPYLAPEQVTCPQ